MENISEHPYYRNKNDRLLEFDPREDELKLKPYTGSGVR
jgi:hypothetical protein